MGITVPPESDSKCWVWSGERGHTGTSSRGGWEVELILLIGLSLESPVPHCSLNSMTYFPTPTPTPTPAPTSIGSLLAHQAFYIGDLRELGRHCHHKSVLDA